MSDSGEFQALASHLPLWSRTLCTAVFVSVVVVPANAVINLVFGACAADKPTATVRKFKPFLGYLSREMTTVLGEQVNIKIKIAKKYQTGIDQFATGRVDFPRFSPASYINVFERDNSVQIVGIESKKGRKRFKGIIAAHADSSIRSLSELTQQSLAFGDELSTIGRYLA
jgi:ABC-type phosphate/phosphonate transport system substrate-binding protein